MPRRVVPSFSFPRLSSPAFFEHLVIRHHEMGGGADEQAPVYGDPAPGQFVELLQQRLRIENHPVADDAGFAGVQDAGGNDVKDEDVVPDLDGVPGVCTPLVAHHAVRIDGEIVDDLGLSLVSPLGAENHFGRHGCSPTCLSCHRPTRVAHLTSSLASSSSSTASGMGLSTLRMVRARPPTCCRPQDICAMLTP